jgi:PEP-CTERM motif
MASKLWATFLLPMNVPSSGRPQPLAGLLQRRLDRYVLACSATAAGAAGLTATQQADGAIVYSGVKNLPVLVSGGGLYFDVEPPFTSAEEPRPAGWEINPYVGGSKLYVVEDNDPDHAAGGIGTMVVIVGGNAANLPVGTQINVTSAFSATGFYGGVEIPNGQTGYIGFKFDPDSVAGQQSFYGWFLMSVDSSNGGTVTSWAYENTGAGIAAGAIPEPGSLAMLAMGAVGLSRWRRRRQ